MQLTAADKAYIRANYVTLDHVCAGRPESPDEARALTARGLLPRPSYVVDGVEMVPRDYFALADEAGGPERLREHFEELYLRAGGPEPEEDWAHYLSGVYGVCLRQVTPETIVRKGLLVESIGRLLAEPRPADHDWRGALRAQVDELDGLEREFSPDYDRTEFGRPPTRDTHVRGARKRYPDVFAVPA